MRKQMHFRRRRIHIRASLFKNVIYMSLFMHAPLPLLDSLHLYLFALPNELFNAARKCTAARHRFLLQYNRANSVHEFIIAEREEVAAEINLMFAPSILIPFDVNELF